MSYHYRKCWDCGAINKHSDNIVPEVICKRCRSQDTRLIKNAPPLWHLTGVNVPGIVAKCPECGGELVARGLACDCETGRPTISGLDIQCLVDLNETVTACPHRYNQSHWQPVRDAIAKWCDAR